MKLKWYGHASFRVTADNGVSVVTDPYAPERAGYAPVREDADVVIISSSNDPYHCRADLIPGSPEVINALELARSGAPRTVKGIEFWAVEAMEAEKHPSGHPDQNGMYRFVVDGVSVAHMGDVGNPLSEAQMAFFDGVDVLLALTGGFPTIELSDLMDLIDYVKPGYVVPMHFQTLRYRPNNILWAPAFLDCFDKQVVDFVLTSEIQLDLSAIPDATRILVLDYAC